MTASTAIVQLAADPRCGAGCWPSRPSCSSAARRSAARSSGAISETLGARYGMALGAVAALAAGGFGLFTVRRSRPLVITPEAVRSAAVMPDFVTPKAS